MSGTQQKYTAQQNLIDRQTLLATGVRAVADLGSFSGSLGGTTSIKLRNVGITTGLRIRVTASMNITVAATASPFGPYPLLAKASLMDYNTTERVSAPGHQLYFWNSFRHGEPWMAAGQGSVDTLQTAQPTAVANPATLQFNLEIPFAMDAGNDLTGAVLAQTVVGEQYLNLSWVSALVSGDGTPDTAPYTAGTIALNSISVHVWQDYIQPQNAALPLIDLNTVYEFLGMYTSSDNITVGGTKYIDWPNVRSVRSQQFYYVENGALTANGTDINTVKLIANGNTNLRELDPLMIRRDMRIILGGDLPSGVYMLGARRNPIQTFIYSQVQTAINFATATGTCRVGYAFESTYPLKTPLPGVAAGS